MGGRKENLKPWQPGQSGNPGGRPKRDMAGEIARAIFESNADTIERVFARALKRGDVKAFIALAERAYGKPRQEVEQMSGLTAAEERLIAEHRAYEAMNSEDRTEYIGKMEVEIGRITAELARRPAQIPGSRNRSDRGAG